MTQNNYTTTNNKRLNGDILYMKLWNVKNVNKHNNYIGEDLSEECLQVLKTTSYGLFPCLKLRRQVWRLLDNRRSIVQVTTESYNLQWRCRHIINLGVMIFHQLKSCLHIPHNTWLLYLVDWLIEHGLMSPSTQYRLYGLFSQLTVGGHSSSPH